MSLRDGDLSLRSGNLTKSYALGGHKEAAFYRPPGTYSYELRATEQHVQNLCKLKPEKLLA